METSASQRWSRMEWLGLGTAVLLALAAYALSVGHDFAYDDVHIIRDNVRLRSLANWREILTTTWWVDAVYRPFSALAFAFDWSVSGGAPAWFHAMNVLLHAGVTALVFVLARRMLRPLGATAAAALFAVHPVHVEAVANVVGRTEILASGFALLAVVLYRADGALAAAGETGWRRWVTSWGVLVALFLGLTSKETAFVTPGLLLLMDWYDGRTAGIGWEAAIRRHWVLAAASVALTAEWLWIWLGVVGELAGGEAAPGMLGAGLGERALVMAPVVLDYLRLLLVPAKLSADYSPDFLPVAEGLTPRGVVGIALVIAGVVAALFARRRAPLVTVALAWMAGALLIVSNLLVVTEILLAERTLYLASVGTVLALGWVAERAAARRLAPTAAVVGLVAGLGLARTLARVPAWRNNETIFPQLVEDAPGSFRSYWVSGMLAFQQGDSARGEQLVRQALDAYPLHPSVWSDLASQLERQRRWPEAARFFSVAHQLAPERGDYAALAIADYMRAGLMDSARAVAARVEPPATEAHGYRLVSADIALAEGRPMRAMFLRRGVALEAPGVPVYWELTADAALRAGYCWEAERAVERIRTLDSTRRSLEEFAVRLEMAGC